jgi:hypothetical protein
MILGSWESNIVSTLAVCLYVWWISMSAHGALLQLLIEFSNE